MKVKIDSAGRIVLPKKVRDRFRLRAGTELELEEAAQGILLRPVEEGPSMVMRDGRWIHLGKPPADFNWETIVEDHREERIKELSDL